MNIPTFLNENSMTIQAVATVVLVGITIFYAIQTRKTVKEMKQARLFEFIPILSVHVQSLSYNLIRVSLKNVGRGLARNPKIWIPSIVDPVAVRDNLAVGDETIKDINVQPSTILQFQDEQRKIRVEYLDVFGRTVESEARLMPETTIENTPRKYFLKSENWKPILPHDT